MATIDGQKTGGRKKGVKNKDRPPIEERAEALGISPTDALLYYVAGDWKALGYKAEQMVVAVSKSGDEIMGYTIDPAVRLRAVTEAMGYIAPKKKSIEHSSKDGTNPFQSFAQMVASLVKEENGKDSTKPKG